MRTKILLFNSYEYFVNSSSEEHPQTKNPDVLGLTPLLGNRHFQTDLEVFTNNKEEAFERITKEFPEEAFFFLNERKLMIRAQLLQEKFISPAEGGRLAYAVKANPRRKVLKILRQGNIRAFDCATPEEIESVLKVHPDAEIFYNHPIKKRRDILFALNKGIRHFTVQTVREVEKIIENKDDMDFENLEIAVRLDTPNPEAGINLSEKFGAEEETVREIIRSIKFYGANPGISIHTGSQNTNPHFFAEAILQMLTIAKEEGGIKTMNIGGGLPANIHPKDHFNLGEFVGTINSTIRSAAKNAFKENPKIIMEPGRAMVAECIDLLIPILSVEKRKGEKVLYIDDGIFTSFSDAIIHGWKYPFQFWRKNGGSFSGTKIPFRIFGRTCDSGDTLGQIECPEDLHETDYLHIPSSGAYMDCQSSNFNGFKKHRYVTYNI